MIENLKNSKGLQIWKCSKCNTTLGIIHPGGHLAIKYKQLSCVVVGVCNMTCKFCQSVNIFQSSVSLTQLLSEQMILNEQESSRG